MLDYNYNCKLQLQLQLRAMVRYTTLYNYN